MTHDKEFYLRLAAVYRLLAKENKHTALEKAYESVAGKPWPYGCSFDYDADYIAFAAEFVLALAGSKIKSSPPLPTPVSYFPVILAPASARPPKSAKQGAYTLALLTKKTRSIRIKRYSRARRVALCHRRPSAGQDPRRPLAGIRRQPAYA